MNTQQQSNVNQALHFKVEYNNEFRRFFLNNPTFAEVEKTLKTLFSINETSSIKIKFLDDEKDWVNLSTDQELQYAVELVERPLRLSVSLTPDPSSTDARPCHWGGKGRWNREKCGGKWKDGEDASLSPEERRARKSTRLSSRIAQLEAKLASGELPSDRTRVLTWRLSLLRDKLANVQAQQNAVTAPAAPQESTPVEAVKQETPTEPTPTEAPARGRGCRGRGRGGCRGRGGRKNLDEDASPSPIFVAKTNLKAARQTGDVEEIKKCREALWEAKQKAKEERGFDLEDSELFREKSKARESGDANQIQLCREELVKAKKACWEVRQAKRESNQ